MTQKERRLYLIRALLKEQPEYEGTEIPEGEEGQKRLLRSPCSIFECRALPVRNFWRYRTLICRRRPNERELPNLPTYGRYRKDLSLARGYYDPAL